MAKLRRGFTITLVALKYFVFYRVTSLRRERLGQRLRLACEQLGPIFVKLGQISATRYDILEKEDCEALHGLLDNVKPVPFEEIIPLLESDFGQSYRQLYREFSETPIASASLSQVYKATTWEGQTVAVKIKRPEITRTIKSDIAALKSWARIAQIFSADLRHIRIARILDQLESWTFAETDFRQEVKNLAILSSFYKKRAAQGDNSASILVFPKAYEKLCSDNVITLEFMEGIPATQFRAKTAGPGYDALASLSTALVSHTKAYLDRRDFVFHADPHPANVLILKDGQVGLLDFGIIGIFTQYESEQLSDLILAVYRQELNDTVRHLLALSPGSSAADTPALRRDLQAFLDQSPSAGFGFWLMEPVRILIKNRVPFPYKMMLFARSSLIMDGLFETVVPGQTTLEVVGPALRAALYRQALQNILAADFSLVLYTISEQLKQSPRALTGLVQHYFNHPLEFVQIIKEALQTT